ncbi:hypothetical protein ACH3XW_16260 [Acanthocheilonema viteae]
MIETNQEEIVDPENPKFQYVFDNLREEFKQQMNELSKLSCQNRNNLLSLIEWLSHSNPTLAAELILQRNDIIAKRINGNLLIASCNSKRLKTRVVEFNGGIINKFEVERIDAELEILSQQHPNIDYILNRPKTEIWNEINNGGVELSQRIEIGFYKARELIQQELDELTKHWRMISFCICCFVILIILIVIKFKSDLICSLIRLLCIKNSNSKSNPAEVELVVSLNREEQKPSAEQPKSIRLNTFQYIPQSSPLVGSVGNSETIFQK